MLYRVVFEKFSVCTLYAVNFISFSYFEEVLSNKDVYFDIIKFIFNMVFALFEPKAKRSQF